jgi:VWFA-related protein
MRGTRRALVAASLLVLIVGLAPAQVPAPPPPPLPPSPQQEEPAGDVQLAADLVLVSAAVAKAGDDDKLVRNLTAADFTVLDEGEPQEVAFFGDDATTPLDVVFLFDASDSMRFREQFQREALSTFLRSILRPNDRGAVTWFSNAVRVEQDFTAEPTLLLSAIDRIPSGGATALYSAIVDASSRIARRPGRRAIVVLSDGRDTFSNLRLEDALASAQRADATIYGINTSFPAWAATPEHRRDDPLEYLASETGGQVYYSSDPDDVEDVLSRLTGRLRDRYVLGFYPTAARTNGRFRKLTVLVRKKNVVVEARRGYFSR